MVEHNRQSVLPAQLAQPLHLLGPAAEVDFAIGHATPVEVLAQCAAVRTAIGRIDENRVERHLATQKSKILNFES